MDDPEGQHLAPLDGGTQVHIVIGSTVVGLIAAGLMHPICASVWPLCTMHNSFERDI